MSALGFIASFLQFAFSPFGLLALLVGFLAFLTLPIIPRVTGELHELSTFALWLAGMIMKRFAIVMSEHSGLLLKPMRFDSRGVETMDFGDETKEFNDPDAALHSWMGFPFALADEVQGILFDPRHAALGQRKRDARDRGEMRIDATTDEWQAYGVGEWVRGAFEFPEGVHELVDLAAVRELAYGGERAEYPQRVEELYKKSQEPFQSGTSATRFFMILVAFLAPFGLMWLLATQGDTGAGGSVVGYGSGALFLLAGTSSNARRGLVLAGMLLPPVAILAAVTVFVSPVIAVTLAILFALGFLSIPGVSLLVRAVGFGAQPMARFFAKLGFMGWEKPVFEWTPREYRLREYDDLKTTDNVSWFSLAGTSVGFTFKPTPDSWDADYMPANAIDRQRQAIADGGQALSSTSLPEGYLPAPGMVRGRLAGYLPESTDADAYYLNSGIAMQRFEDAAMGEKALRRLLYAKEKYGGDSSLSDKTIIYAMLGAGTLSTILGVVVFFL